MWKALAIKELRDVSIIVVASALAFILWTASTIGIYVPWFGIRTDVMIPFLTGGIVAPMTIIAGAAAVGLGLRQSTCLSESSSQFLLHRPVERWRLIAFKLAIGLGIVCSLTTAVILLLTVWAAIPGSNPAPFEFWMTTPAWIAILCVTVVYNASFLAGLRQANWLGTRLLPIVGIVPITFGVAFLSHWSFVAGAAASVTLNGILWIAIHACADRRDFA